MIGKIELEPLAGTPNAREFSAAQALEVAGAKAIQSLQGWLDRGVDYVLVENRGDIPFFQGRVPPETIASMAIVLFALREIESDLQLGVRVLSQDARGALALASVTGCDFMAVEALRGNSAARFARKKQYFEPNLEVLVEWTSYQRPEEMARAALWNADEIEKNFTPSQVETLLKESALRECSIFVEYGDAPPRDIEAFVEARVHWLVNLKQYDKLLPWLKVSSRRKQKSAKKNPPKNLGKKP